jgi:hypothetical protein
VYQFRSGYFEENQKKKILFVQVSSKKKDSFEKKVSQNILWLFFIVFLNGAGVNGERSRSRKE